MTMSIKKTISTMMLLVAALCVNAAESERKLPVKMEDVAARLKSHCPSHVNVSSNRDELIITINKSDKKDGFTGTYSFHALKRLAGRSFTFALDVKLDNVDFGDAAHSGNIGQVHFGDTRQLISIKHNDWHTYYFKGVKIPGSGMLKLRISVKKISGEIHIRNLRIRGNFPKVRDKNTKKKKKKD